MTEIVLEREIEEELLDAMNVLEHTESKTTSLCHRIGPS